MNVTPLEFKIAELVYFSEKYTAVHILSHIQTCFDIEICAASTRGLRCRPLDREHEHKEIILIVASITNNVLGFTSRNGRANLMKALLSYELNK